MKIFFATDIHGSEICWRKFLNAAAFYKADLVVLGGDVTGKIMVPIVAHNGYWEVTIRGERRRLENREALQAAEKQLRDRGSYPAIVTGTKELMGRRELRTGPDGTMLPKLAIDATGVGRAVVDMFMIAEMGCEICPVVRYSSSFSFARLIGMAKPMPMLPASPLAVCDP